MKRITAKVGSCRIPGTNCILHALDGWVCPSCHCQSELALDHGKLVCALCRKALQ